jgi:leader peptidase (prepilin peptidase) / N-methyltransferase
MIYIILIFLIGICVGSFINVLVLRTRKNQKFLGGRSKCRKCEQVIKWYDLIPLLSFFMLRKRCRGCKEKISWQYPLVELVTGLLFILVYLVQHDALAVVIPILIFTTFLIIIFIYDLKYQQILDRFSVPAMVIAFVLNLLLGVSIWSMLIGAALIGGFFLAQWLLSKGTWIGDGDIRLGVLMGLILGWQNGLVALFLAYVIGALVGVIMLATKKAGMKTEIPFGTFLAAATLVSMLWASQILDWYFGLFI